MKELNANPFQEGSGGDARGCNCVDTEESSSSEALMEIEKTEQDNHKIISVIWLQNLITHFWVSDP